MLDFSLDYQMLRHSSPALWLRAVISRWLGGKSAWPIVFRAPGHGLDVPDAGSANLYVHLPFCRQICPHCPYNKVLLRQHRVVGYGSALQRELVGYLRRPRVPRVQTIYFGGGTPSQTPELIEHVMAAVQPILANGAEVGVEVHPADASPQLLQRLRRTGVNRVSLGIETLRPDLLRKLGRRYTPDEGIESIRSARAAGFDCVDVNLIHGIPGQSAAEATADATICAASGVDQISAYPLFSFAHTSVGRRRASRYPERERLRAQKGVARTCRDHGLERTSVWSFTRAGVAPYTTVTREDYVGFGAGAGSKVGGIFWFNTFSVPDYTEAEVAGPALIMQAGERLQRLHWLYWAIYSTHIDSARYSELFGRRVESDFGALLVVLSCYRPYPPTVCRLGCHRARRALDPPLAKPVFAFLHR